MSVSAASCNNSWSGCARSGSKEDLDAVSDAFETFLSRISSRRSETNYSSLSWVAETFYSLATSLDDPTAPAADRAKILLQARGRGLSADPRPGRERPQVRPRSGKPRRHAVAGAVSLRRIGDFDGAIKLIVEVLKQRPTMLTAQIAGAETYAAQGAVDAIGYLRSIKGGVPDQQGKNLIWGWSKLANKTQGNSKFEETFYHARLKIAEARFLYGLKEPDPDASTKKIFDNAKNDLWVTFRLYPELGGPQSSSQYDLLLKRIQQQLHQPLEGLREFKEREAAGGKEQDQKANSA